MYGLSAPLVQWIGHAEIPARRLVGNEDVKTAQFLLNLNSSRADEQLVRLNLDGRMGDWQYGGGSEWQFDPGTVLAVHRMKREEALIKVSRKMKQKMLEMPDRKTWRLRDAYRYLTERS